MKATEKQISYLKFLLKKNNMDTRFVGSDWKRLGFRMRERQGRVEDLSKEAASRAIDALLK